MEFVLTERFCQDPVEEYFGKQRKIGRRSDNPDIHRFGYNNNTIRIQRGAICSDDVHKIIVDYLQYDQSYLDSLPDVYKTINPESVERQVKELGIYSNRDQKELQKLSSCILIDETEQSLKSMEDYKKAFENSLKVAPQLEEYLKKYLVPIPACCKEKTIKTSLEEMTIGQIDANLRRFYAEARKKDGEMYGKKTLLGFRHAIERRGREGQRQLTTSSFKLEVDAAGRNFITMAHDEVSKNHPGGLKDTNSTEKNARIYETNHPNDGYRALRVYISKLNPKCTAFFQYPKKNWASTDSSWYENRPVGINKLDACCKEKTIKTSLEEMTIGQIDANLRRFYAEARKKDGEMYGKKTLLGFRHAIERYLNQPPHCKTLKMSCDPRRGREGQRQLTTSSFKLEVDAAGRNFITMAHDEVSKNHPGGLKDTNSTEKNARIYETNHPNDGYRALRVYISKLNPKCTAFFQYPKKNWASTDSSWFPLVPMLVLTSPDSAAGTAFLARLLTAFFVSRRRSARLRLALATRRIPVRARNPQNQPRWWFVVVFVVLSPSSGVTNIPKGTWGRSKREKIHYPSFNLAKRFPMFSNMHVNFAFPPSWRRLRSHDFPDPT
ncbi:hypothetical protein QZH41_005923 [Actinostola sp. cb2023]|nr:hypothetical protein QZH41_005923 [Actinostola sp. cb2023]